VKKEGNPQIWGGLAEGKRRFEKREPGKKRKLVKRKESLTLKYLEKKG